MAKTLLKYSFATIAAYLVLARATGAGKLINGGDKASVDVIKAFQGR